MFPRHISGGSLSGGPEPPPSPAPRCHLLLFNVVHLTCHMFCHCWLYDIPWHQAPPVLLWTMVQCPSCLPKVHVRATAAWNPVHYTCLRSLVYSLLGVPWSYGGLGSVAYQVGSPTHDQRWRSTAVSVQLTDQKTASTPLKASITSQDWLFCYSVTVSTTSWIGLLLYYYSHIIILLESLGSFQYY